MTERNYFQNKVRRVVAMTDMKSSMEILNDIFKNVFHFSLYLLCLHFAFLYRIYFYLFTLFYTLENLHLVKLV